MNEAQKEPDNDDVKFAALKKSKLGKRNARLLKIRMLDAYMDHMLMLDVNL